MFTFKFIRGTTRFVIVVNNEFVIKIANPLSRVIKNRWWGVKFSFKKRNWAKFTANLWLFVRYFFISYSHNLKSNLVEGWCYIRLGKKLIFLTPTFTFGLFNIQPYVSGSTPSEVEVSSFLDMIFSPYGDTDFMCMSLHEFDQENWKITPNGMMLLDFGGVSKKYKTLSSLFFKYQIQISERLAAQ